MRHILRQSALTAVSFAALYLLVLGISLVLFPAPASDGRFDVWTAGNTLYLTSPKYAFLGRDILNVPDKKVILVGASNTGLGLKQTDVQALLPCAKVSNLAIGSANITEVHQLIDLVHDVQDDAARKSDTFVIGIWFGMFVDTERLWPGSERQRGDTDIDIERYRYGFYRRTAAGPVAVLPARWLHAGVTLIRPYLLLEKVARDLTAKARAALFVRTPEITDVQREAATVTEGEKTERLAYWSQVMGPTGTVSASQVALLQRVVDDLVKAGERVVLVDLPIPDWHRDASPYQQSYVQAVQQGVLARFAQDPNVTVLSMPDLAAGNGYSDEVHAKPSLSRVWAGRLADVLRPQLCGTAPTELQSGRPNTEHAGVQSVHR